MLISRVTLLKSRTLHEHAAAAAGVIVDQPVVRLDNLGYKYYQRRWREKLAAFLTLAHGKLAQEILVDLAEGVPFDIHRDGIEGFQ